VRRALLAILFVAATGCGSAAADLQRARVAYAEARYEDAHTWLTGLEGGVPWYGADALATYYLLRGMTDYHLGARDDALYHLSLARAAVDAGGGRLSEGDRDLLERALGQLTPLDASHRARPAP